MLASVAGIGEPRHPRKGAPTVERWFFMTSTVVVSVALILILIVLHLFLFYSCIFPIIYNDGCFFG